MDPVVLIPFGARHWGLYIERKKKYIKSQTYRVRYRLNERHPGAHSPK